MNLRASRQADRRRPVDEGEHFYRLRHLRQAVDKRDLFAVLHHEQEEHEPLPVS